MNRTIKEATVRRFHYDDHDQLRSHLADFVQAATALILIHGDRSYAETAANAARQLVRKRRP
jgi:hypothetical protein